MDSINVCTFGEAKYFEEGCLISRKE